MSDRNPRGAITNYFLEPTGTIAHEPLLASTENVAELVLVICRDKLILLMTSRRANFIFPTNIFVASRQNHTRGPPIATPPLSSGHEFDVDLELAAIKSYQVITL